MAVRGREGAVWVYVVALAVAAAAVSGTLPRASIEGADRVLLPLLVGLVAASECWQVRFRLGGEIDGSNFVEAAIAPLLLVSPTYLGVLVVAAGQVVAAVVRRNSPVKAAFNVAQWSLAAAVGAVVWTAVPDQRAGSLEGAALLLAALLALGVLNLVVFTVVLLLMGRDLRDLRPLVGLTWSVGLGVNAVLGLLFALAYESTPYALVLAPVPLLVLHLAYRGYAEARADQARLTGMHRAAQVLSDPLDPLPAIPEFLRAVAEVFEAAAATLVLRVDTGREVHRLDLVTAEFEVVVQDEDSSTLEGALSAQLGAVWLDGSRPGPLNEALREVGRRDGLAAPMIEGGRVFGALLVMDQTGLEGAPAGQLRVLEALAREAAAAFGKGRLLSSVLEERRKLSIVVSATSDGIAAVDEHGLVRSWNPALEAITGLSAEVVVGIPGALAQLDARSGSGAAVDLAAWADGDPMPPELSVRQWAAGRWSGRRRLACSYSHAVEDSGRTLVVVARDVTPVQEFEALRLEFARLVEQEAAHRLVVEQLHAAVVPATPVVDGLELAVTYVASDPKEPTGGDLWDWHVLPTGELHVAVVDVLGHGVAATKSALSVVHTLRAVALDGTPLDRMVERASVLLERQDAELVATVVLARLDPATGRLLVASGGHPPALAIGADGSVRQVGATGGAIGWPGAGSDGLEESYLATGDALLLYTDGLVEARKDILEGLDSLSREAASVIHLPAAEMTEALVARALAGADRRDDTLALVIRMVGEPVAPRPGGVSRSWQIGADAEQAARVRRDGARWLADQGVPASTGADLSVVMAELLANSVAVAGSQVQLDLAVLEGRVEVTVTDDGPGWTYEPRQGLPDWSAEGGRGLFLVRELTNGLEVELTPSGTVVRCWLAALSLPTLPVQATGVTV